MMNACDSIRVSMASKMSVQAITTRSSEPPLIATGHENIKDDSPLIKKWEHDKPGKVVKSDKFGGKMEIEIQDSKKTRITIIVK